MPRRRVNVSQPLLDVRNLKKYFRVKGGDLHAVDDVSVKINASSTLGVVGESGCGKSTLGRTILRLHEPTSGKVFFDGEDVMKFKRQNLKSFRTKAQIIFQDPYSSLNPRMSVEEIIAEFMIVNKTYRSKSEIKKRTAELMDIVGLAARLATAYPHELDGGRRQRIGIARALSVNPKFIVCDEPVSALDVSIQAQILNLLMDLQRDLTIAYMFITHDLSVVKHISNEIAVMYLGKCVEIAPSGELFRNPRHPYTKALIEAILVADISMRYKKIEIIKGEIASPVDPRPGCRFAVRCPFVGDICSMPQELVELSEGHFVACSKPL